MMASVRRAALAAIIAPALSLVLAGTLLAAGEGRIIGTVLDDSKAPIEGAKVVLTRPGTGYKLEKVTDGKGQFMLLVLDATQDYQIHIEKAEHGPFDGPVKAKVADTVRMSFELPKLAPAVASAPAPKEMSGTDQAILAYNEGVTALRSGNVAGAMPSLEKAASLNPQLSEAQAALSDVYLELKRYGDALAAADRYLALKPGDVRGLRNRYDALKAAGDNEKAREALEALSAADPSSAETAVRFFNAGAELARAGKLDEAASFFQRVVEIAPADPRYSKAHYVLGMTFAKDETKKEQARQQLQTFLQMAPTDPDAGTAKEMLAYLK